MPLPQDRKGQKPRASQVAPTLDAERLRQNAVTSIRLGLEDFQRCQ